MLRLALVVCLAAALGLPVEAQRAPAPQGTAAPDTARDTARVDRVRDLPSVVVAATRSARALEDVPVPTSVVTRDDIETRGLLRLSDLLAEQPGLAIVSGLGGTGVQLQGFDAAYTLVLLDGEPLLGRTAGTLDLDRLAVTGVERVEIVRGPLSSRYGADALAGVINLVTARPGAVAARPGVTTTGRVAARLESSGTADVSAEAEAGGGRPDGAHRWGVRAFVNRYGSPGYSARPDQQVLTIPVFADYAVETRARYAPRSGTEAALHVRAATQAQQGTAVLGGIVYEEDADRTDLLLHPTLRHRLSPTLALEGGLYGARFQNRISATDERGNAEETRLLHDFGKAEGGLVWTPARPLAGALAVYAGGGLQGERVAGDRYADARTSQQAFGYAEAEWRPLPALDLVLSARYDAPSDYAARLTPKAAALYRVSPALRVRGSVGSGYRAPAFRQRYLSFGNAAGGYTLYGAEEARTRLAAEAAAGGIERFLISPEGLGNLRAESSMAYGLGVELEPRRAFVVRVNAFHNEVRDLIDSQPVAIRTNGQQVFSYFNLARIYTRGVEADVAWASRLVGDLGVLSLAAGYQLLDTADRDVLAQVAAGTLFRRDAATGRDVRVSRADYGGLFGRSRHSGVLRLTHRHDGLGLTSTARLALRSRYGFADLNGNGVLDEAREFAPGYALLNASVSKRLGAADLHLGVLNVTGFTDPERLPSQPGRVFTLGVSYRL
ncbi:MAG: TonB-dependent receptor plug domain-containing protein [Rubricoccaceae bacterium]